MRSIGAPALLLAAVAAAAISLTNCSGSGGNASSVVPPPKASPSPAGGVNLYVGNNDAENFVQYIPTFSATSAPAITVSVVPSEIVGITANSSYVTVAAADNENIEVFSQPVSDSSTPAANIDSGTLNQLSAFDASGDLWVATENNTVVEFTPPLTNASTVAKTVSTDVSDAIGVAFDASNNLYVTNTDPTQLLVFAPPYTGTPTILNLPVSDVAEVEGVAVSGNELAIGIFSNGAGLHTRGAAHGAPPSLARRHTSTWTVGTRHRSGAKPFGTGPTGGEVLIYTLPITASSAVTATFQLPEAFGVAFDAAGNLYVSAVDQPIGGDVSVFDPPFTDSSTPVFAIASGIDEPEGLTFGP